jgi:AcrR family transcriptional regulator
MSLSDDLPQPPDSRRPDRDAPLGTKEQLLDAAESLIADHGVDGASVRAITERAGANIAAVNYHFGSKDGLVRAAFARRIEPINRERLRLLESCLAAPGGPTVEAVVSAFVTPPLRILGRREAPGFGRCMIRALADPGERMRAYLSASFQEVIERFIEALRTVLPGVGDDEIYWRFHFMIGAMAYTVGMGHLVEAYSGGACRADDIDAISDRLVRFGCAGIGEAAPSGSRSREAL